jgi:hypothetical protein
VAWWSSALTPSREGAHSIPNPGTPFPTLGIGCFTLLPGSGWQVLVDSQHGSMGSEKSDTLQKMVAGQPEPDPQKKKKNSIVLFFICASSVYVVICILYRVLGESNSYESTGIWF